MSLFWEQGLFFWNYSLLSPQKLEPHKEHDKCLVNIFPINECIIIYTFIQASYIPVLLFFRGGKVNVNLICMIELFLEDKFGYRFIWNLFIHFTGSLYIIFCPSEAEDPQGRKRKSSSFTWQFFTNLDSTRGIKIQMTTARVHGNKRGKEQRQ